MTYLKHILIVSLIAVIPFCAFAFGGKKCRNFEKKTEAYFKLFYKFQDKDGIAKCKANDDCLLSTRGPCNRQEIASKLMLNKKQLRRITESSKAYKSLFEDCAIEVCDKTPRAATGTKCTEDRCELSFE